MKTLYILLTRSPSIVSKMIHLTTGEAYTHSSLAFSEDSGIFYSFGRKYTNLPLPAGLKREVLQEGFFKKHEKMPCALYAVPAEDGCYRKIKESVLQMMQEKERYRYNLLGLAFCHLQIPWERKNRYFCSEFICTVLQNGGAMGKEKAPSLFHPQEFAVLPGARLLYKGDLLGLRERLSARFTGDRLPLVCAEN